MHNQNEAVVMYFKAALSVLVSKSYSYHEISGLALMLSVVAFVDIVWSIRLHVFDFRMVLSVLILFYPTKGGP